MAEFIRSVKISVEIDTNKRTIKEEFPSLLALLAWANINELRLLGDDKWEPAGVPAH